MSTIRTQSRNKYHAEPTVVDGKTCASKKEAKKLQEVLWLFRAGEITDYILQPKFLLQERFTTRDGKKERAITYRADFALKFRDNPVWTIWEVKGGKATRTRDYELRRKMFLKKYPCVEYQIV
jgi:hypothetical protein